MAGGTDPRGSEYSGNRRNYEFRRMPGRRKEDELPKSTVTRKGIVAIVGLVNLVYLVLEAFALGNHTDCL